MAAPRPRFKTPTNIPPVSDGKYHYELDGEHIKERTTTAMRFAVRDLRTRHGLPTIGDPIDYVAEYMCPTLPDGWCTTPSKVKIMRADEVKANTVPFFSKPVETFDVADKRLIRCVNCPAHDRTLCVTCTGLVGWVSRNIGGGRRPRLQADDASGVCSACGALSAAIVCSRYSEDEPVWENAPATCWRRDK